MFMTKTSLLIHKLVLEKGFRVDIYPHCDTLGTCKIVMSKDEGSFTPMVSRHILRKDHEHKTEEEVDDMFCEILTELEKKLGFAILLGYVETMKHKD